MDHSLDAEKERKEAGGFLDRPEIMVSKSIHVTLRS